MSRIEGSLIQSIHSDVWVIVNFHIYFLFLWIKKSRNEAKMHAYAFCGSNEGDPRASSKGREGTEAIPFGDVC